MITSVLLVVALAAAVQDPPAQGSSASPAASPTWQPYFALHVENDSLPGAGADDSYTQGLELHAAATRDWPVIARATRALWRWLPNTSSVTPLTTNSLVVGQTMFTPHNLITYFPSSQDRPYVSHLYTGFETTLARFEEACDFNEEGALVKCYKPARLTVTALAGFVGPAGLGRDTQSAWHVLRENRLVKGWLVSQSGTEPQVNVRAAYDHIPLRKAKRADLTLSEEVSLGTTQTFAGGGITLRVGRALTGLPSTQINTRAKTEKTAEKFEFGLQAGIRGRYYGRNAFIAGSFRDPSQVDTVRGVGEISYGAEVRWKQWRTTYLVVRRSKEYSPVPDALPKAHQFVAINVSREAWTGETGEPWKKLDWLKYGARANLRFGRGYSSADPARPLEHDPALAGSLGLEHAVTIKGLRLSLGYEQAGVGREEGPPGDTGFHSDVFLTARAFTVGWEPTPVSNRHKLQIRAGGGPAAVQLQVIPDTRTLREPEPSEHVERGTAWLGGLRYAFRLGRPLSLVFDVSRSRITSSEGVIRRSDVTAVTFGLQLHPWSRDTGR